MIPPIIIAPMMTSVQLPPFLADAERKLAQQLERMEEERKETKAELARAAWEKVDAEKR